MTPPRYSCGGKWQARTHLGRVFFFFSSRRRHTRYWRDWSSDVCSSDLVRSCRIACTRPAPPEFESLMYAFGSGSMLPNISITVVSPEVAWVTAFAAVCDTFVNPVEPFCEVDW